MNLEDDEEPPPRRAISMLIAVSEGRGEITCSCVPDLYIDGLSCCDQYLAHKITGAGLVRPVTLGPAGQRVRAELSMAGVAVLRTHARGSLG